MSFNSQRLNRILIAAGIGLIVAICASFMTEESPSAAIARGDFPAFYTLAALANSTEGHRLYDLDLQRAVQNAAWPTLDGTVLPAAYPAFLAYILKPLAILSPSTARIVWVCCMLVCTAFGARLLSFAAPSLRGFGWQLFVGVLLFAPLLLGVIGGQIVGLSFLLYAALVVLATRDDVRSDALFGAVAGLWMYKPHYALAIVALILFQQRWVALCSWGLVTAGLWFLGALVAGADWIAAWLSFVQQFSQIDMATNAYQMTGFVAAIYSLSHLFMGDDVFSPKAWEYLVMLSAMAVPLALFIAVRRARDGVEERIMPLLVVGPLLLLCAPAVNFYDLALGLVPLIALFRPQERRDLVCAGSILMASQVFVLCKGEGVPGVAFVLALVMVGLVLRGLLRSPLIAR